ncbi:hypothetical protein LTR53_012224 [Teratosphaeriaceae sp. CCFEE 6253]|nr:hypothetical protein LTR53_012224 [Teratosphaeriaceae sp. CCFEE 6253]
MEPPAGVAAPAITEARDEASSTVRVAQLGLGAGESGAEPVGVEPIPVKRTAEGGQGWGDGEPPAEDGDEEMESEVELTAEDREMLLAGEEEDEDEDDKMGGEGGDGAAESPDDGMAMTAAAAAPATIGHDWSGGQFADLEVDMDDSVRNALAGIDAAAAGPAGPAEGDDDEIVDWEDVDLSGAPAGASSSGADDVASRATGGQSSLLVPSQPHPHPARSPALSPPQSGPAAPAIPSGVQPGMTAATASDFDAWLASQGYSLGAGKQGTKRGRARDDAIEDALGAEALASGIGLQAVDRAVAPAQGPAAASPAPAAHDGDSARQQGKPRANAAAGAPQGEVLNAMEPTAAYKVLAGLERSAVELRIVAWTSQSCMDLLQLADSAERGDVATAKEIYELDIIKTRLAQMAEYVQEAAGDWRGWRATFRHGAQMQYSRQHLVDIEKDARWLSQCYANAAATSLEQILQLCGHLMRGEAWLGRSGEGADEIHIMILRCKCYVFL